MAFEDGFQILACGRLRLAPRQQGIEEVLHHAAEFGLSSAGCSEFVQFHPA
jgi:hypothetical protein